MVTVDHKINERVVLIRESDSDVTLRIRRIADGYYFNHQTTDFESYNSSNDAHYSVLMQDFDTGLKQLTLVSLPDVAQDLLFIFTNDDGSVYERHIFGGPASVNEPTLCTVYGTLKNVSGEALSGQKIEAYLNRAGYFTHKAGLIGYAATALTDETGYFELPLMVGLDVTITVPIIGFTSRGFVPNTPSVELTTQALLSYQPS